MCPIYNAINAKQLSIVQTVGFKLFLMLYAKLVIGLEILALSLGSRCKWLLLEMGLVI